MSAVTAAYGRLLFTPEGIDVGVVHSNRQVRTVENPLPVGVKCVDPGRRGEFESLTRFAVGRLQQALDVRQEELAKQNIAYRCPDGWRDAVVRTLGAAGCPDFDLLTIEEAESVCFFDEIVDLVLPIARRWRESIRASEWVRACLNQVSPHEIEHAVFALEQRTMTVALVGTMKAGKSTFMNALLGQFVLPALNKRCTRRRFSLKNFDERGRKRMVVVRRGNAGELYEDPVLSLDVNRLGWTAKELRAYLFALNSPRNVIVAADEMDDDERWMREEFDRLPLDSETQRLQIREALTRTVPPIDSIEVTHPFHELKADKIGRVLIWDTPGPDGVDDDDVAAGSVASDHTTFQNAVQQASALILVFDVTKQGSQSQFDVLKSIAQLRGGRTGSVLVVANKVDLRQVRNVEPLDILLKNIQTEVQNHGIQIRPVIPVSSRPAQIAREIMALPPNDDPASEIRLEFDTVVRASDLRENAVRPDLAVERRSNVRTVEDILVRFFRREGGRSILVTVVERTLAAVGGIEQSRRRDLAGLTTEQQQLIAAAHVLEIGATELHGVITISIQQFEQHCDGWMKYVDDELRRIAAAAWTAVEQHWRKRFKDADSIDPSELNGAQVEAERILANYSDTAKSTVQKATQEGILLNVSSFWSAVSTKITDIESRVDIKLGLEPSDTRVSVTVQADFMSLGTAPGMKIEEKRKKDYSGVGDGAAWGAGVGAAGAGGVVIGALVTAGPVGWALLAGIALATAATGAGVGAGIAGGVAWLGDDTVTKLVRRDVVLKDYKAYIDSGFRAWSEQVLRSFATAKTGAIEEIRVRSETKLKKLRDVFDVSQNMANNPERATKISALERDISAMQGDLAVLTENATRIGVRFHTK